MQATFSACLVSALVTPLAPAAIAGGLYLLGGLVFARLDAGLMALPL